MRKLVLVFVGSLALTACVSHRGAGTAVPADFSHRVLVDYAATGPGAEGLTYHLVFSGSGRGMFERNPDGSGTLYTTYWSKDDEKHYFGWIDGGDGFEFVIPDDETRPGVGYVYAAGTYELVPFAKGLRWPRPYEKVEPVRTLTPLK